MRKTLATSIESSTLEQLKCSMSIALKAERFLAGYKAKIAARSDELNKQGSGDPTEDVMRGGGQVSKKEATKQAARTKVARKLPKVGKSLHEGDARPENIDSLARTLADLTDDELEALQASDEDLANRAEVMPPENFRRHLQRRIAQIRKDAGQTEFDQQRSASRAHLSRQLDSGMHTLYALLDPERGAALEQAIKSKTRSIARREGGKDSPIEVTANLRAQALYELIMDGTRFHDSKLRGSAASVSRIPSITLITDIRTFLFGPHERSVSETWAGTPIPPKSLARNACDACVHEVVIGLDGEVLNAGRDYRTVTDGQRRALRATYSECPISGASFADCEIHHVKFWEDGGPTDLANLVPISRRWHHLVHDEGWSLQMTSNRTLIVHRPDGSFFRQIPPPEPLVRADPATGDGVARKRSQHTTQDRATPRARTSRRSSSRTTKPRNTKPTNTKPRNTKPGTDGPGTDGPRITKQHSFTPRVADQNDAAGSPTAPHRSETSEADDPRSPSHDKLARPTSGGSAKSRKPPPAKAAVPQPPATKAEGQEPDIPSRSSRARRETSEERDPGHESHLPPKSDDQSASLTKERRQAKAGQSQAGQSQAGRSRAGRSRKLSRRPAKEGSIPRRRADVKRNNKPGSP